MHFSKVSALVAQFSLTTTVLGAEDMGRRNWQAARDRAVERAADFEPRAPMVTSAPRGWQADRDAGLAAAAAAISQAREAIASYRNIYGNHKRDDMGPGPLNGDGQWQDAAAPTSQHGPWNSQSYDGQYYNNDNASDNGNNNANDNNHGQNQQVRLKEDGDNWENGPAPAPSGHHDGPSHGAAAYGDNWHSYAADWEQYGSSVAASYSSEYHGGDNWHTAAESGKSVASSYKSEYGVPEATPMHPVATMGGGSTATSVRNQAATPTSNRVQVNAAEGPAGGVAEKVMGVGALVMAVAAVYWAISVSVNVGARTTNASQHSQQSQQQN